MALSEAEPMSRLAIVSDLGTFALSESDLQTVLEKVVTTVAAELDVPLAKILRFGDIADQLDLVAGIGWHDGLVGHASVGIDRESQAGYTLMSDAPVVVADLLSENRFSGPPLLHDHGVRSGISVIIAGPEDRPFGVFGVHTTEPRAFEADDVAFLVAAANIVACAARQADMEERRTVLARQMAHRSGNILQLAASIFRQTLRTTEDPNEVQAKFSERLGALSRANMLVASGGWRPTRFTSMVRDMLEPFSSRIELDGPDIVLPAEMCFDLGLVLHELLTNSAKFGAFAHGAGRVRVSWRVERDDPEAAPMLEIVWEDSGDSGPPRERGSGYGSRLKAQIVEGKLGGTVSLPGGDRYRCIMRMPIRNLDDASVAASIAKGL